jgi:hypothetical protein
MPVYVLHHSHDAADCAASYAAWKGFRSPLRRRTALSSCVGGGHEIWWQVTAANADEATDLLPRYVAARTVVSEMREVFIP